MFCKRQVRLAYIPIALKNYGLSLLAIQPKDYIAALLLVRQQSLISRRHSRGLLGLERLGLAGARNCPTCGVVLRLPMPCHGSMQSRILRD
eukprot:1763117-Pleurochrysis_carterae.AAC.1